MLRFEVSEAGHDALPAIDSDDVVVVIGSSADARVRLPASAAQPEHVRIEAARWRALGPVSVEGDRSAGTVRLGADPGATREGDIGDGVTLVIDRYRVRIAPAPAGTRATPPQRTESLARELARSLLGGGAAPSFEVERGPVVGARRQLAPPESVLVIGRGDEADWIVVDEDLSRRHAEVRRGWDGTRIVDLGSKNGTRLDGETIGGDGALLRDGALVELGKVALRFRDPAEQHLRGSPGTAAATPSAIRAPAAPPPRAAPAAASREQRSPPPRASTAPFYVAVTILIGALAGLVWILSI